MPPCAPRPTDRVADRAGRDRPVGRLDRAARNARGDARRPRRLLRGCCDARRSRRAAHRGERERRRVLRLPGALARIVGRAGRPRGAGPAERAARTRRLRLAPRRCAPGRLLVGRVPRPDRGDRRSRSHAVRSRDLEPELDDRVPLHDVRARRGRAPACRHPYAGVLRQRRGRTRGVGQAHVRSVPCERPRAAARAGQRRSPPGPVHGQPRQARSTPRTRSRSAAALPGRRHWRRRCCSRRCRGFPPRASRPAREQPRR